MCTKDFASEGQLEYSNKNIQNLANWFCQWKSVREQ